jgi:hypothetical protein
MARYQQPTGQLPTWHQLYERCLLHGWSTLVGNSATQQCPRGGAPWSVDEESDLLGSVERKIPVHRIAAFHGRTENAIGVRLELLRSSSSNTATYYGCTSIPSASALASLARYQYQHAMDAQPRPSHILSFTTANGHTSLFGCRLAFPQLKEPAAVPTKPLKLHKLHTLLTIAIGVQPGTLLRQADFSFLLAEGLIDFDPNGKRAPWLTEAGELYVSSVIDPPDGKSKTREPDTVRDPTRQRTVMADGPFYMVANGDVSASTPHGLHTLLKPPTAVRSGISADTEAKRLAALNPGEKFFVLKAVSVHQTPPVPVPPVQSKSWPNNGQYENF